MINRFMQKRIIIMLLGLITAIALFGVLNIGLEITASNPIGNTLGSYISQSQSFYYS
jgi:hypothetical protein